ncbi:MAG: type ISP restriction/modification enzyme [Methylococcaceae bacterium]|nr:type ISP restriction/modification enzyme [Methylococcaceae bacterium]
MQDRHGTDVGIDLVARERYTGDYCAIQCKFYDPASQLQKSDIDSFFTESGKVFSTNEGTKSFTSRIIVSTTDKWSKHAEAALEDQQIPVIRLGVADLANSPIDWSRFSIKNPQDITLKEKKSLRPHQQAAFEKVEAGFKTADRGKLIMACGTGKTFTALKIAEHLVNESGLILFLVPSISLLSQTLREWTAEANTALHCLAVCSDKKVGKNPNSEDISVHDLAFPATTNAHDLSKQISAAKNKRTVIFSTYQSIQVISDAQKQGLPIIDLIICDEAHRTTGVTLDGDDDSHFVKVHNQDFIQAKKRLYMTATPRIFNDNTKTAAKDSDAILCSMDDENLYGEEFYRLGFSQALDAQILCDYKVMVLAVDEKYVTRTFQAQIADSGNEITLADAAKITGCWNGLSKRGMEDLGGDTAPMRRAVAFAGKIKDSETIAKLFSSIVSEYAKTHDIESDFLHCEVEHVDGKMNALQRNQKLDWLKADTEANVCRILSNARCLSEGVDVPSLDAVLFLNPRDSVVDVVQSVGRVMRKSEGKQYGYVILPITIPADMPPEEALKDNKRYKVVWQVLQALRAHDDRFNATVNKIALNKTNPANIQIIGVSGGNGDGDTETTDPNDKPVQTTLQFPHIEEWRDAIYAKIVAKCGERDYWEKWAKEIAVIAETHITRINVLLESGEERHQQAFQRFLTGLQAHLNPSISQADAVEMLAQHLITKPVFDALFEGYEFTQHNPVSLAMQTMLDVLEDQAFGKETKTLEKFYDRVRQKASGIDNAAGKQKIIIELYDKFFKNAFPRMAERLGIVYTPVEVVDFIIHSADDALRQEFGVGLTDENVHILDPFTGTGTFMVRLLQSSLIKAEDLARKYEHELHANEIILLAYYIAAINIEETYHDLKGGDYSPFQGIVLTDTFQLAEGANALADLMSVENGERANRQKARDIQVIIGNPPYSAGQASANDNNQNVSYKDLDDKIAKTYTVNSKATLTRKLYDSYIRGIRWASDRIKNKGMVCYVTNGSFIDSNAMDGLRYSLTNEFSRIYCFNLRGNIRKFNKEEGQNIFGSANMTPVAITLLIRNPEHKGVCELFYHDIGDCLSQKEKLEIISQFKSINGISWQTLTPNDSHDWIDQRNEEFESFISVGNKDRNNNEKTIFLNYSLGIATNRDTWVYNFSKNNLTNNTSGMIGFYNSQVELFDDFQKGKIFSNAEEKKRIIDTFIDTDTKKISWTRQLKKDLGLNKKGEFNSNNIVRSMYRPYCKQWLYFDKQFNEMLLQIPKIFPNEEVENLVICVPALGARRNFSTFISNTLPDLNIFESGSQCFPLYTYEPAFDNSDDNHPSGQKPQADIFGDAVDDLFEVIAKQPKAQRYQKKENITEVILQDFRIQYQDAKISKEDIFYYVYGVLHSPEYKQRFASDLKKMLPRIPFVQDFWVFSQAGRDLAQWHLNYETIEPYALSELSTRLENDQDPDHYRVQKMTFAKSGKEVDKTTIHYNGHITLSGIPLEAYEYIVNGKPALEWIIERYQVTKDKDSDITNNPNDWSDNPRYIIDLVKRIVRVSVETVKIVNALPALNEFIE